MRRNLEYTKYRQVCLKDFFGPLLVSLYINDWEICIAQCQTAMFADEITISKSKQNDNPIIDSDIRRMLKVPLIVFRY